MIPNENDNSKEVPLFTEDFTEDFTEEDLEIWIDYKYYFVKILNGTYDLNEAREDLRSLIGSKYDSRVSKSEPNKQERGDEPWNLRT